MNTNLAMLFFLIAPVALISLILVLAYFEKWGGWYFFALILSVIWLLLPVLPTQLSGLFGGPNTPLGQTADDFQQGIASWYGMPLFLICSTFIMYFWCGTKATVSKSGAINVIKSQKTVWTALAIVFFALSTWATSLYLDISPRVDGLTATSRDLGNTYKLLHHDAESIVDQLQNKDKAPSISNVHYLLEQFDSQISLTLSLIEQRQKEIEALTTSSDHLSRIPSLASSAVTSLTVPLWTWQELQGLKQAKILITNIRETAKQGDPLTHSGAYSTDNNYTQFWESHLLTQTDDLASLANTTQPDERTPLILTLALMMVFVLFPWLLCISFIVSKRATVVRDNRITLQRLGLIKRIIHSSGSRGNFVESADRQRARDLINLHEELNKSGPNGVPTQLIQRFKDISALIPEDSTLCELFERLRSFFRSYESCISLGSSSNTNEEERQLSMRHLNWTTTPKICTIRSF